VAGHAQQGLDLASIKSHPWTVRSCSARVGTNIEESFDWIVTDIAERIYVLS